MRLHRRSWRWGVSRHFLGQPGDNQGEIGLPGGHRWPSTGHWGGVNAMLAWGFACFLSLEAPKPGSDAVAGL